MNQNKIDTSYSNTLFWWFYITCFQGYDDATDMPLMEAIESIVDINNYITNFDEWYAKFAPREQADADGMLKQPPVVELFAKGNLKFTIQFHVFETQYYLNDIYFGNLGGHFEAWFLTWDELCTLDDGTELFLLLLPMVGIVKNQQEGAAALIGQRLKQIALFAENADYIARLITDGLSMQGAFEGIADIGITCSQPHSVRNIRRYPRYIDDVRKLNCMLGDDSPHGRVEPPLQVL